MNISKTDMQVLISLMGCLSDTCRDLGIKSRITLPIGGRYPDERFIRFKIAGRMFTAMVYNDQDPWTIGIEIVEKVNDKYREALHHRLFFVNGHINTVDECAEWGVYGDGYDIRLLDVDAYLFEYMLQTENSDIDAKSFKNVRDALEYYAAWETREHREKRIERQRKNRKVFDIKRF